MGGKHYIGCDMIAGPGVDRVERVECLTFADGFAGTVLCLNVFEHTWDFLKGAQEIFRVTAPGGLALVTAPFEFKIHGYPEDYWRFTPRAVEKLFDPFPAVIYGWQGHPKTPRLVFALGLKSQRNDLDQLAEAWRQEVLEQWKERPTTWKRLGAAMGGAVFGRRGFRHIRHGRDLTITVRGKNPSPEV